MVICIEVICNYVNFVFYFIDLDIILVVFFIFRKLEIIYVFLVLMVYFW